MDTLELLKEWPCWHNATSATIVSSPAFCLPLVIGGERRELRPVEQLEGDTLNLAIRFEEENAMLSLADSEEFPDLHLLWTKRSELPQPLILALVEKECGNLLQALENAAERQLFIRGLADEQEPHPATMATFTLGKRLMFGLEMTPKLMITFGKLANLDTSHEAIRLLMRPAWQEYAVINLPEDELPELKEGAFLLMKDDFMSSAQWVLSTEDKNPPAGELHLLAPESTDISFAQFADDSLPAIVLPEELTLYCQGKALATGVMTSIGDKKCFKLIHSL